MAGHLCIADSFYYGINTDSITSPLKIIFTKRLQGTKLNVIIKAFIGENGCGMLVIK